MPLVCELPLGAPVGGDDRIPSLLYLAPHGCDLGGERSDMARFSGPPALDRPELELDSGQGFWLPLVVGFALGAMPDMMGSVGVDLAAAACVRLLR